MRTEPSHLTPPPKPPEHRHQSHWSIAAKATGASSPEPPEHRHFVVTDQVDNKPSLWLSRENNNRKTSDCKCINRVHANVLRLVCAFKLRRHWTQLEWSWWHPLLHFLNPNGSKCMACLVKDHTKRSFFIRVCDIVKVRWCACSLPLSLSVILCEWVLIHTSWVFKSRYLVFQSFFSSLCNHLHSFVFDL